MSLNLKTALPSDPTTTLFEFKRTERFNYVCGRLMDISTKDADGVLREVRRMVYTLGLHGGFNEIQEEASGLAIREQREVDKMRDPLAEESKINFTERLRKWRSYIALRALSILDKKEQMGILGDIDARLRDNDNYENALLYFDAEGKLTIAITEKTPLDVLMDIVAFAEHYEGKENIPQKIKRSILRRARLAALEYLTERLITKDPRMHRIGMECLRLRHFREILKSVPGALGKGRIGGKAAGMLIAYSILEQETPEFDSEFARAHGMLEMPFDIRDSLRHNKSYFLGSNIFMEILAQKDVRITGCHIFKYGFTDETSDTAEQEREYQDIKDALFKTGLPEHLTRQLKDLFHKLHGEPCIVRSSSELEDRFGAAFVGKYESVYLANSSDFDSDFGKFIEAIKQVYASVFSPDVMRYRTERNLTPYNEEMGLLIQHLNGKNHGRYFCPLISGVAMSHATESWGPNPNRGAMRIAVGLGKTVVDGLATVSMFANPASNPNLGKANEFIQEEICVINTEDGAEQNITTENLVGQMPFEKLGQFQDVFSCRREDASLSVFTPMSAADENSDVAITFNGLLNTGGRFNNFALMIEYMVQKLKCVFGCDVDIEFTADIDPETKKYLINVVQCRPQNIPEGMKDYRCPASVPEERVILHTTNSLSCGRKPNIQYIVYVPSDLYKCDPSTENKLNVDEIKEIRRWICEVDKKLGKGNYLLVAPGRLGSNDPNQGIPVTFSDFMNAAGIVEIVGRGYGAVEPSFGTHFYQDLVEAGMGKFAVSLESDTDNRDVFNGRFLDNADSITDELIPEIPQHIRNWLKVIPVNKAWSRHIGEPKGREKDWRLHVAMTNRPTADDGKRIGTAYIAEKDREMPEL